MSDPVTLGDLGKQKIITLCQGLELDAQRTDSFLKLFDIVSQSWSHLAAGGLPIWHTNISDDNTPFEFSIEFRPNAIALRILFESLQLPITFDSSWKAGLQLHQNIQNIPGVDFTNFERCFDLFAPKPEEEPVPYTLWHSAVVNPDGQILFKAYFNPQVHGLEKSKETVRKALHRLKLDHAWDFISSRLENSDKSSQLAFFCVDLSHTKQTRVKIYLSDSNMSFDELEFQLKGTRNYHLGQATRLLKKLGGVNRGLDARHVHVYFAFTSDQEAPTANMQIPIRLYVENDAVALDRTIQILPKQHQEKLKAVVNKIAGRPLEKNRGIIAYVGVLPPKEEGGEVRVTTYISAEAFTYYLTTRLFNHQAVSL